MASLNDILVITTASTEQLKIKTYLKPISTHIVAGTNFFSDFGAGLSDVFGGRSSTYEKQLTSLYNSAIKKIKIAAYEIGANAVIGLKIDMDEISGKGKSMFMLTAIGTAVILEKQASEKNPALQVSEKFENVTVERINLLRKKKEIISKAESANLVLTEEIWDFICHNQIEELFPFLLKNMSLYDDTNAAPEHKTTFYKNFVSYINGLNEEIKTKLLYDAIERDPTKHTTLKLCQIINEIDLFNFERIMNFLESSSFDLQKLGVRLLSADKPYYNRQDIINFEKAINFLKEKYTEKGTRTTKKQLLSKEKEVWLCDCGHTVDIGKYCHSCFKDIYGFLEKDAKPIKISLHLKEKIQLINEFID